MMAGSYFFQNSILRLNLVVYMPDHYNQLKRNGCNSMDTHFLAHDRQYLTAIHGHSHTTTILSHYCVL